MILEWLCDLLAPFEPGSNWTLSGMYLEHLFEDQPERKPDRDDQS